MTGKKSSSAEITARSAQDDHQSPAQLTLVPGPEGPRHVEAVGSDADSGDRNASLDGLRAISIFGVLLVHAGFPLMPAGWLGVDVFLVLSGFLICTLLLQEQRKTGTINLPKFWMRRFLRLMPAYLVYAVILTTAFAFSPPETKHVADGWHPANVLIAIWTYTVNYLPLGGLWDGQWLVRHLWSLSLEEQFYLIFPILILSSTLLISRFSAIISISTFMIVCILIFFFRLLPGYLDSVIYGRGISLLIGCLTAAILFRFGEQIPKKFLSMPHVVAGLSAFLLFVAIDYYVGTSGDEQPWGLMFLFWVATAIAVGGYWYRWSTFGARILSFGPAVFIGRISYGIYLFHMLAWGFVWNGGSSIGAGSGTSIFERAVSYLGKFSEFVLIAIVIATVSYYVVERPFLRLKALRFRADRAGRSA